MPPTSFFLLPITTVFLLSSLGLVSKELAGLAVVVKDFNTKGGIGGGSGGSGGGAGIGPDGDVWGPDLGPNFSDYTFYLPSTYTATTPPNWPDTPVSTSINSAYGHNPYAPSVTGSFSIPSFGGSDSGSGLGNSGSDESIGLDSGYSTLYDPYETQLNSILDQFSDYSFKKRTQPTGQVKRVLPSSPTIAPLIIRRQAIQPAPTAAAAALIKRQSISQGSGSFEFSGGGGSIGGISIPNVNGVKAKTEAALAFFAIQLASIIGLLGLTVAFLFKHRKYHKGGFTYETTTFFHSFHLAFAIVTSIYFLSGLVCFAILGSESKSQIGPILAATIALWSITIVCLFGLLFTLKMDARKSAREEHGNENYINGDGVEYGKDFGVMNTPAQHTLHESPEQQQQQMYSDPPISMPQPPPQQHQHNQYEQEY